MGKNGILSQIWELNKTQGFLKPLDREEPYDELAQLVLDYKLIKRCRLHKKLGLQRWAHCSTNVFGKR